MKRGNRPGRRPYSMHSSRKRPQWDTLKKRLPKILRSRDMIGLDIWNYRP